MTFPGFRSLFMSQRPTTQQRLQRPPAIVPPPPPPARMPPPIPEQPVPNVTRSPVRPSPTATATATRPATNQAERQSSQRGQALLNDIIAGQDAIVARYGPQGTPVAAPPQTPAHAGIIQPPQLAARRQVRNELPRTPTILPQAEIIVISDDEEDEAPPRVNDAPPDAARTRSTLLQLGRVVPNIDPNLPALPNNNIPTLDGRSWPVLSDTQVPFVLPHPRLVAAIRWQPTDTIAPADTWLPGGSAVDINALLADFHNPRATGTFRLVVDRQPEFNLADFASRVPRGLEDVFFTLHPLDDGDDNGRRPKRRRMN